MPFINVKVTDQHITSSPARGYGPRIIIAALQDRLVDRVYVRIDLCWAMFIHQGARYYVHLPLQLIQYTFRMGRVPLLQPITFRIELPAQLVRPRSRTPRRRAP